MAELASLQIKVVRDGIEQAQKALNDLAKAADNAEKSAGGVGKGFDSANKQAKSFGSDVMSLAKTLGGLYVLKEVSGYLIDLAGASIQARAGMEQQEIALTTMLGSAQKATALIAQMKDAAMKTPFSFEDIVQGGKSLIAFGESSETAVRTMTMLGDVAAGVGIPINDLIVKYGQIRTQQVAYTQDLKEFAGRGVPIYAALSKTMGITTAQVKQFASEGKIGFSEIQGAFKSLTEAGGQFAGLMEKQADSLTGKWSNFNDALNQSMERMGKDNEEEVKGFVDELNRAVEKGGMLDTTIQGWGTLFNEVFGGGTSLLKSLNDEWEKQYTVDGQLTDAMKQKEEWMRKYTAALNEANQKDSIGAQSRIGQARQELVLLQDKINKLQWIKDYQERGALQAQDLGIYGPKGVLTPEQMAEFKKTKGGGSGDKYNYASELKYANDLVTSGMSEAAQLTVKYNEQIDRLSVLQNASKKGSDAEITAWNAKMAATKKYREEMEKLTNSTDAFGLAMKDVGKQLANTAVYAAADGFEKIGEALGKGEMSGKAMKKIMAEMVWQIIEALPMMFVAAGVNLIAQGGIPMLPVGLSLIGMGLAGQIGVGYVNGRIAAKEAESSTDAAAHGAVYGFARGGSFTNEIVNSPTRFMFGSGGTTGRGLMGEAGTEAVVPLRRMSNGNLGVESSGGGEVNVTIINGSGEPVNIKKEKGSNGGQDITVAVGAIVSKQLAEGAYDSAFRARYGIGRRGI